MSAAERRAVRDLVERLDALLKAQVGGDRDWWARHRAHRVTVVYGPKLGAFQTLSVEQARDYLALLEGGQVGAPWQLGIS